MDIREEGPEDTGAVGSIYVAAFGEDGGVVAALVNDLRSQLATEPGLSLVAESRGEVVGHVMFTRGFLDAQLRLVDVAVLSPLAVAPDHQHQGIGSALVRSGLDAMAGRAVPAVFLEGDPDYYSRFGFVPGGPLGFRKPSLRIPDPAFQVVTLSRYEPWMTGTLVYGESFWRHDSVGLRQH